ncbi:MAG: YxeA family protein [Lactococcus petauri]
MKKLLLIVILGILISTGGVVWYIANYSNKSYYVQIHNNGEIERDDIKRNSLLGFYKYNVEGFDAEGVEQRLVFTADHNLRIEAYLKVKRNAKRGVISWEEVKRESIPKKALYNLDRQGILLAPENN